MITAITRWGIATLLLVGLAWLSGTTGNHIGTFLLLFGIMTFVALYGGHGKRSG